MVPFYGGHSVTFLYHRSKRPFSLPLLVCETQTQGQYAGHSPLSPLRYLRAFIFFARRVQPLLPSLTRIDLRLPTLLLLGPLGSSGFL